MDIADLLKDVPLFDNFSDEEIQTLAEMAPPIKEYEKDEYLIREGDLSSTLFLLVKGVCLITREQDGANIQLSRLKPGEIFGEMSWVSGKPRQSNVVANEDVTAIEMDREFFDSIPAEMSSKIKDYLIELLIKRLDNMNEAIMRISKLMRT
jgi:CRP-like cAMP-binding protein